MKRCPTCSRVYDDVNLRFCLGDGTELMNKVPDAGPPETAVMPGPSSSAEPTISAPPPQANPIIPPIAPTEVIRKKSMLPWVIGAGALLLVFGVAAVAAIILLRPKAPLVHHLVLQVPAAAPNRDEAVGKSVAVIKRRLDAYGVSNFEVKPGAPGSGQILVDLPALENPERVKQIISAWGKLEFVHVISPPSPQAVQTYATAEEALEAVPNTSDSPAQRRVLQYAERSPSDGGTQPKRWVAVEQPAIVDGAELTTAPATASTGRGANYDIQFSLNKAGATKFGTWTASHIDEYLGIVLDDEVKSIDRKSTRLNSSH